MPSKPTNLEGQRGYIALMAALIISFILLGLAFVLSTGSYYSRFNVLDSELKRISLGSAESCQNVALLEIAENNYSAAQNNVSFGGQSCKISSVVAGSKSNGLIPYSLATQASYQGAFSDINVSATVQDPTQIYTPPTTLVATVSIAGGGLPSYTLTLDSSNITSGATNNVTAGVAHTLNTPVISGYSTSGWAGACTSVGSITPAASTNNSCYINYSATPTTATITLIANITPSGPASTLTLVGSTSQTVTSNSPVIVPSGIKYIASFTTPSGYQSSGWGGSCNSSGQTITTLVAGQYYTCVVNFTQPSVACADTVVMLDRTASMFDDPQDPVNEASATESLLDLYSGVSPQPKVGVGSMGGLYPNGSSTGTGQAWVPDGSQGLPSGLLTNIYGSRISSGSVPVVFPKQAGTPSPNLWTNPTNAFSPDSNFAINKTAGQQETYGKFGVNTSAIPSGATITGIAAIVDGYVSPVSQTTNTILSPSVIADNNSWTASGTTNKVTAVTDYTDNTKYIISTAKGAETFKLDTSALPSTLASINSITLSFQARRTSGSPTIQLFAENGTSSWNNGTISPTSNWVTYSTPSAPPLSTNPFTGKAWTLSDLSSIGFGVNETSTSGTADVGQIKVSVNYVFSTMPTGNVGVALSWNNGNAGSWSSSESAIMTGTESQIPPSGNSSSDKWGHNWAIGDLVDGKLLMEITNNYQSGATVNVNYVTLQIYYSVPSSGLYKTIDTMTATSSSGAGSHIAADINAGAGELTSSRHGVGLQKVLILISDGVPTDSKTTVTNAANVAKGAGINIFTIHFGDSSGTAFLDTLSSGAGYYFDAPTSSQMIGFFNTIGTKVCPAVAAATQANLNVTVSVINANGGTGMASSFGVNVTNSSSPVSAVSSSTSPDGLTKTYVYPAFSSGNLITVTESQPSGYYSPQYITCPGQSGYSSTIPTGQTVYCTMINYDTPAAPSAPPPPPPPSVVQIGSWQQSQ